jgi:hypothetical protein
MEEEKKKDLLESNDFEDLDIGAFKIKKKAKIVDPLESQKNKDGDSNFDFMNLNTKYIKVDEMNVIKVAFSLRFFELN